MKIMVNIIGFIIDICNFVVSGIRCICIFWIFSSLTWSREIRASCINFRSCLFRWFKWACFIGSMKIERKTVFTIMIDEPTINTVGTKYRSWNGNAGSRTPPAKPAIETRSPSDIRINDMPINNTMGMKSCPRGISGCSGNSSATIGSWWRRAINPSGWRSVSIHK